MPATLVLTATITPAAGMPGTLRSDPAQRRREYLAAFEAALALPDLLVDQIAVLENSDADLSDFARLAEAQGSRKRIQLVPTSSDYPADRGKGYGEFYMLDQGLTALAKTGAVTAATKLWKITGRLTVTNLAEVIRTAPAQYDLYCDLRNVPLIGERLGGNQWMELRLFSFSLAGYDALFRGKYDTGFVLEKSFFPLVLSAYHSARLVVFPRFTQQPIFAGYSGFSNADYSSRSYRYKNALRRTGRAFFPFVWL